MEASFGDLLEFPSFDLSSGIEANELDPSLTLDSSLDFDRSFQRNRGFSPFRLRASSPSSFSLLNDLSGTSPTDITKNGQLSPSDYNSHDRRSQSPFDPSLYQNNHTIPLLPIREPKISDGSGTSPSPLDFLDDFEQESDPIVLKAIPLDYNPRMNNIQTPVMAQAVEDCDDIRKQAYKNSLEEIRKRYEERRREEELLLERQRYKKQLEALHQEYLEKVRIREEALERQRKEKEHKLHMKELRQYHKERIKEKQRALQQEQSLLDLESPSVSLFADSQESRPFFISHQKSSKKQFRSDGDLSKLATLNNRLAKLLLKNKSDPKNVLLRQKLSIIKLCQDWLHDSSKF